MSSGSPASHRSRLSPKKSAKREVQSLTVSAMCGVMMMFSNPMYATSDGGKLEKIKRQKAIVKFDPDTSRGDIKIVVANRFLVTVKGNRTTVEDLKAYAKAIDYKKMSAMQ